MPHTLYIFTDGSSTGRVGPGGWAFVVTTNPDPEQQHATVEHSGYHPATTNNRMELQAFLNAMEYALNRCYPWCKKVEITSDSQYVAHSIQYEGVQFWQLAGWIKEYDGEPVKNRDLWEQYLALLKRYKLRGMQVFANWQRGHAGHYFNERCDKLAKTARVQQKINPLYDIAI